MTRARPGGRAEPGELRPADADPRIRRSPGGDALQRTLSALAPAIQSPLPRPASTAGPITSSISNNPSDATQNPADQAALGIVGPLVGCSLFRALAGAGNSTVAPDMSPPPRSREPMLPVAGAGVAVARVHRDVVQPLPCACAITSPAAAPCPTARPFAGCDSTLRVAIGPPGSPALSFHRDVEPRFVGAIMSIRPPLRGSPLARYR